MTSHTYDMLLEPRELAARLDDPDTAVLDCRHDLAKRDWGAQAYAEGHIPGALFAHLDRDLSGAPAPHTGRHPLPAPAALAAAVSHWGIDERVQVVAYDQGNGAYAARAWWLLRWLGHAQVAVLNGGFAAWQAQGLPVSRVPGQRTARRFTPRRALTRTVTTAEVQAALPRGQLRLVDARAADRFAGRNETVDPVAGHIPGAVNHPFARNLDPEGRFLPRAELARRWSETAGDVPCERIAVMCGSGVTACHDLLAMELAGMSGASLYAGSWSEWIRDPSRAVAREEKAEG